MDHLIFALPHASPYLELPFADGTTPLERVIRRVRSICGDALSVTAVVPEELLSPAAMGNSTFRESLPQEWAVIGLSEENGARALARIDATIPAEVETLIWVDGDAPFTSVPLTAYLLDLHRRSWCDYTFADGFPEGYASQILRREILPALVSLAESRSLEWNRSILFDSLNVDINSFDIETEAASEDYSLLRASLTVATRADYTLCRRLAQRGTDEATVSVPDPFSARYPDRDDPLLRSLLDEPIVLRTLPRYYMIQVTEAVSQYPLHAPWSEEHRDPGQPDPGQLDPGHRTVPPRDMEVTLFSRVVEQINRETPEAIIAIGYRGEPGMHAHLDQLIGILKEYPGLTTYIETSGVGWSEHNLLALEQWNSPGAIIVELDAATAETYRLVRGEEWEEARAFIERFSGIHPGRLYVQATRMKENESELQAFFQHWSAADKVKPLIQKYNSYAGRLPDRRVADLQPLERVPCRHLERDMVILVDGRVPRCHQDLNVEELLGDLTKDSLREAWEAGEGQFRMHLQANYPQLCRQCDEYYTINA